MDSFPRSIVGRQLIMMWRRRLLGLCSCYPTQLHTLKETYGIGHRPFQCQATEIVSTNSF